VTPLLFALVDAMLLDEVGKAWPRFLSFETAIANLGAWRSLWGVL
jgi:hypothetical protein